MGMDWGASDSHVTAASWVATAAKGGPLPNRKFIFRERMWTKPTEQQVAKEIISSELALKEAGRFDHRIISHDAATERRTLKENYKLHFESALHQVLLGISNVRYHFDLYDLDKPHPFRSQFNGQPLLYLLVEDDQGSCYRGVDDSYIIDSATDEKGLLEHRVEISSYRWDASGKAPVKKRDDMADALRMLAWKNFPTPKMVDADERKDASLPEAYRKAQIWLSYEKIAKDDPVEATIKLNQDLLNRQIELAIMATVKKQCSRPKQALKVWQRPFGI
jgi:hypothetical protein